MYTSMLGTMGSASLDGAIALGVIVCLAIWGFVRGREVIVGSLMALYPAMLVVTQAPYAELGLRGVGPRLFLFCLVFGVSFYMLRKHLTRNFFWRGTWRTVEVVVLAIVTTGVLGVAFYHAIDIGTMYAFSPFFDTLFLSPVPHFAWLIAPLVVAPLLMRG